jgi:hypothetical protein
MNTNVAVNYNDPNEVRKVGVEALMDALGPIGMARFFQDFGLGSGDYTAERGKTLEGITLEDIIAQARAMDNNLMMQGGNGSAS